MPWFPHSGALLFLTSVAFSHISCIAAAVNIMFLVRFFSRHTNPRIMQSHCPVIVLMGLFHFFFCPSPLPFGGSTVLETYSSTTSRSRPRTRGNRSAASCLCTVLRRALYHYATRSPMMGLFHLTNVFGRLPEEGKGEADATRMDVRCDRNRIIAQKRTLIATGGSATAELALRLTSGCPKCGSPSWKQASSMATTMKLPRWQLSSSPH